MTIPNSPLPGLVLVEGLPGTGKSTTSHLLSLRLKRHGVNARWYYEHETPHPVFEYPEVQQALDHGQLRPGLFEDALGNWRALARSLDSPPACAVIESSFLQTAIHPMLLLDFDGERIGEYARQAAQAIETARPALVLLRHPDPGEALHQVAALRGDWFLDFLIGRVNRSRFAQHRGLEGLEAAIHYLRHYQALVDRIVAQLAMPVLPLPVDQIPKAEFVDRIANWLGLPETPPVVPCPSADLDALAGTYRDTGSQDCYHIVSNGTELLVDGAPPTPLIPTGALRFELLGTCVHFDFLPAADRSIQALDCIGNLPGLARQWVKQ